MAAGAAPRLSCPIQKASSSNDTAQNSGMLTTQGEPIKPINILSCLVSPAEPTCVRRLGQPRVASRKVCGHGAERRKVRLPAICWRSRCCRAGRPCSGRDASRRHINNTVYCGDRCCKKIVRSGVQLGCARRWGMSGCAAQKKQAGTPPERTRTGAFIMNVFSKDIVSGQCNSSNFK